ncbi:isoprenylcysteine carboxylmethyltransferase family protein [Bosea sp. (in: a-proteobacteria)]|uniref:methyltransferase family protein n=1 Tax=Bosea sp. (in: a-proteobacteria) TaxID=1871050 RepID=UPI001AD112D6|nr:isoprenylcysteine carboxylmethyltransferase family protein [Bosea sp. (in: a-proteobacteria)]MBN9441300.1 isoprenylcysteine carboxylmethyltransferase family protein [Bosea sp. (in: a-proteobacteria)]
MAEQPPAMPPAKIAAYIVGLPLALFALLFLPAGDLRWRPGWLLIGFLVLAFGLSVLILLRVNPLIFRARSRFQPGTKGWDLTLLSVLLPVMVAELPVAALDAGRFQWSSMPVSLVVIGYVMLAAGIAGTSWAQAVNPFFEPGVRIQSERDQRVVDSGPYGMIRHPGYSAALLMFWGLPLALGSFWALLPALIASVLLIVRTGWEDSLLQAELPGYRDYAQRVRYRLLPAIW